jgi:putative hydrolase of the HAD superfamily
VERTVRRPKARKQKSGPKPRTEPSDDGDISAGIDHNVTSNRLLHLLGPASEQIEAVTFDVGGTLIECWPSVGHIYAEVAARFGHRDLSATLLNRQFRTAWRQLKDFRHTPEQWSTLVDATFQGVIEALPSLTFFPELFKRFSEPGAWHIFDDVLPILQALKDRGVKLGIISNWDDRLRPLLEKLKLDSYFQTKVISCEIGQPKPSRLMFDSACHALESNPLNTVHIGDSHEMDFEGARAAGLQALWLRRGQRCSSAGEIQSLSELNKI